MVIKCFEILSKLAGGLLLSSLFFGCASYVDHSKGLREAVYTNKYEEALEKLESSPIKDQNKNRLLYQLEKSVILDRLGKLKESRKSLMEADRLIDELYTESISKEAATYLINDSVRDYAGEDYEKVAVHTMLAFSFIESGKLKSARVEAKKINSRLRDITQEYDDSYSSYTVDAFALLVSGLVFEALGEYDDAIIDYRKSLDAYKKGFIGREVPTTLIQSLYICALRRNRKKIISSLESSYPEEVKGLTKDSSSLVFFAQGFPVIPKFSQSFVLSGRNGVLRYSWPVIPKRRVFDPSYNVRVNNQSVELELAQNMNKIARDTLDSNRTRMTVKNVARLIAKAKAAQEIERRAGPIAGLLANLFAAATETADTRSWSLLPGKMYVKRVFTEPGKKTQVSTKSLGKQNDENKTLKPREIEFLILKDGQK